MTPRIHPAHEPPHTPESRPTISLHELRSMFYDGWPSLLRVVLVGVSSYILLVFMLRLSGKRTLSKMNVFDLVVTVALGSTLASLLLSRGIALADGILAFALLISLQFIVAWLSVRSSLVSRIVKADPRLLFYKGSYLHAAMRSERVTEAEVLAAIRASGIPALEHVGAVILETDGSFTVTKDVQDSAAPNPTSASSALTNVEGAKQIASAA